MNKVYLVLILSLLTFTPLHCPAQSLSPSDFVQEAYGYLEKEAFDSFCNCIEGYSSLSKDVQEATVSLLAKGLRSKGTFVLKEVGEAEYTTNINTAKVAVRATINGVESSDVINVVRDNLGRWRISGKGILY